MPPIDPDRTRDQPSLAATIFSTMRVAFLLIVGAHAIGAVIAFKRSGHRALLVNASSGDMALSVRLGAETRPQVALGPNETHVESFRRAPEAAFVIVDAAGNDISNCGYTDSLNTETVVVLHGRRDLSCADLSRESTLPGMLLGF